MAKIINGEFKTATTPYNFENPDDTELINQSVASKSVNLITKIILLLLYYN